MISAEFLLGLAAGLIGSAVLYLGLRWWARRVASSDPPPAGAQWAPADPPGDPALLDLGIAPGPPAPGSESSTTVAPALIGEALSETVTAGAPGSGRGRRPSGPPEGTVRLSQRVILHVYSQGSLPAGAVAPPGLCQAGIGEALGIPQSGLAAVLRRLEAAEILQTERGHVRGRDRRLKIYRLTSRGEAVAKELRARSARPGNAGRSRRGPGA